MSDMVTIAVDALGGDHGPSVVLPGVEAALKEDEALQVLICGPEHVVVPFADAHERCTARVTTEEITMDEHPATAVRKKKDSSLVVGCRAVKEGDAQGFFSAGSTGACLVAGTLVIGRIKGIERPALGTVIPSPVKPVFLCDVGANADAKPEYLVQFAQMSEIYVRKILGIEHPTVALLNIGEEETKGNVLAQQSYELLKERVPAFVGNAEGGDVLGARFDILVTDGFTGNVVLKTIEGTSKQLFSAVKGVMFKNALSKLGAALVAGGLKELKSSLSADTYGGVPLLGVKGACIVGHGGSNEKAVKNGIHAAAQTVRSGVSELIAQSVSE